MATLRVHDLPQNKALDRKAMSAVRGGWIGLFAAYEDLRSARRIRRGSQALTPSAVTVNLFDITVHQYQPVFIEAANGVVSSADFSVEIDLDRV